MQTGFREVAKAPGNFATGRNQIRVSDLLKPLKVLSADEAESCFASTSLGSVTR